MQAAKTRCAVCMCPSVDRCEWDRLGRRPRNIREASRAGARPRSARGDRRWGRTSRDDRRPLKRCCSLQPLTAPGQSFIDEVLQEPLPASRLVERAAVEDAVHLLTNGLLVGFAPVFERNYRHSPTPNVPRKRPPRQRQSAVSYRYILGLEGTACHASGMIVKGRSTIRSADLGARKADAVAEAKHTIDCILSRQEG